MMKQGGEGQEEPLGKERGKSLPPWLWLASSPSLQAPAIYPLLTFRSALPSAPPQTPLGVQALIATTLNPN